MQFEEALRVCVCVCVFCFRNTEMHGNAGRRREAQTGGGNNANHVRRSDAVGIGMISLQTAYSKKRRSRNPYRTHPSLGSKNPFCLLVL